MLFACIGHAAVHLTTSLYYTLIIPLQREWGLEYDQLLQLWTVGALLMGIAAPVAGWLSDRWDEGGMMVAFFLITGVGSVLAGFSQGPAMLGGALALLGFGASIYHPAGMAWAIRNARDRARVVGWVGISGDFGFAAAAPCAGLLAALAGWRWGFMVPGLACVVIGLVLARGLLRSRPQSTAVGQPSAKSREPDASGSKAVTAALVVTMFATSLISWSTAAALPRWFATAFDFGAETAQWIGALVGSAYLIGSIGQYVSARATGRFSLKRTYLATLGLELPFLLLATAVSGPATYPIAICMALSSSAQLVPETLLIARHAPAAHRGLAFGIRFVLSFAAAPIAVQLVAMSYGTTGDFTLLFGVLAAVSCLALIVAALLLPHGEARRSRLGH